MSLDVSPYTMIQPGDRVRRNGKMYKASLKAWIPYFKIGKSRILRAIPPHMNQHKDVQKFNFFHPILAKEKIVSREPLLLPSEYDSKRSPFRKYTTLTQIVELNGISRDNGNEAIGIKNARRPKDIYVPSQLGKTVVKASSPFKPSDVLASSILGERTRGKSEGRSRLMDPSRDITRYTHKEHVTLKPILKLQTRDILTKQEIKDTDDRPSSSHFRSARSSPTERLYGIALDRPSKRAEARCDSSQASTSTSTTTSPLVPILDKENNPFLSPSTTSNTSITTPTSSKSTPSPSYDRFTSGIKSRSFHLSPLNPQASSTPRRPFDNNTYPHLQSKSMEVGRSHTSSRPQSLLPAPQRPQSKSFIEKTVVPHSTPRLTQISKQKPVSKSVEAVRIRPKSGLTSEMNLESDLKDVEDIDEATMWREMEESYRKYKERRKCTGMSDERSSRVKSSSPRDRIDNEVKRSTIEETTKRSEDPLRLRSKTRSRTESMNRIRSGI